MNEQNIAVVHLVRSVNEISCFEDFVKSYTENEAGVKHNLILIYKGFAEKEISDEYLTVIGDIKHTHIRLSDDMTDLDAYFLTAKKTDYSIYLFLNSFSKILDKNWLQKMANCLSEEVGLVGATGSWQRLYDRNPIRTNKIREKIHELLQIRFRIFFPKFPNCHIRTNAFLIRKKTIEEMRIPSIKSKFNAHKFESGYQSLTRTVTKLGYKACVVGRDGNAYFCTDWKNSFTYRSGEQKNLLIEDNQTRAWSNADSKRRALIELITWGDKHA